MLLAIMRGCRQCKTSFPRSAYSKNQWRRGEGSGRCRTCCGNSGSSSQHKKDTPPTIIDTAPRPQIHVPGFDGKLTVCSDWPQTKKGRPPGAQSAIFNPLLAAVLGPIAGHCSTEQLLLANAWWTAALPAWPRWVKQLRAAKVLELRSTLLKGAKGTPNPLIHKARGRGTVPHFRGRAQNNALEMVPMVAIEVYACVTCLYSKKAMALAGAITSASPVQVLTASSTAAAKRPGTSD